MSVGYSGFCGPTLDKAFDQAVGQEADSVTVITPVIARDREHAWQDIPETLERAKK